MRLIRLYSNNCKFKNIEFNNGFNLILGKVTQPKNKDTDTHNLGKTTLVELIDLMLLKNVSGNKKNIFNKHKEKFVGFTFYLEILLNSGTHLTIRRSISSISKVSLKVHDSDNKSRVIFKDWDYEDLSVTTNIDANNAKYILNRILSYNVTPDYTYRSAVNYYLRKQSDYSNEFQLSKFYRSPDAQWKPMVFELLGFNSKLLKDKYLLTDEVKTQTELKKEISKKLSVDSSAVDKLKGVIQIKEEEKIELEKQIDEFNFYLQERKLNKVVIEDIESEISVLNSEEYNLCYDIKSIKNSLDTRVMFDMDKTKMLFDEVNIFFSEQLVRSYEELIAFNKELTKEREKYLTMALKKKSQRLDEIHRKLKDLNQERQSLLSVLNDKDTFSKFKTFQSDIIAIERELSDLNGQIDKMDIVKGIRDNINQLEIEITQKIESIKSLINEGNVNYKNIRRLFSRYLKEIINTIGIISIIPLDTGNITFEASLVNESTGFETSQGEGNSYKQIMCVCYDLAILSHYSDKDYFKFAYHDGSLESLDDRKKINYLDLMKQIARDYNLQVIITAIESDIPYYDDGTKYEFEESDIALELTDASDNGRLFGFSF